MRRGVWIGVTFCWGVSAKGFVGCGIVVIVYVWGVVRVVVELLAVGKRWEGRT